MSDENSQNLSAKERIIALRNIIQQNNAEKLFLIDNPDKFDSYSINFNYRGGTITYCDWRGPEIQFETNNTDKLISYYLQLIADYKKD
ncbi:hypothetical protein [Bartonella sp. HY406]|uniref:hypothetical protein n=1 Tax=Bartonella sp. HY406 TaxID=2979331 RepID=UPI0021C836BC|nr:hypothetical protein [Bartonella sp. HY406]UXN02421.1 hypothetical protein N6B01_07925 [Bartonella sp. HY406]